MKDFTHIFQIYFIRKSNSYIWGSQEWAASQAFFRFFNHKFKKAISTNNMFIRPLFSRKPSSDCLQCFIKVAFKIISIAGYLYSSRYVKLFIVWNRKKFVRYNVNGTLVINLTFFASFAKEIPYEDKFSRGFNFVNARFEIFRVDLISRINTFERFR